MITFLQRIGVLQTARHHALHHTDPKNSHYCTVTNVLNPVLAWNRVLERVGMDAGADDRLASPRGFVGARARAGAGVVKGVQPAASRRGAGEESLARGGGMTVDLRVPVLALLRGAYIDRVSSEPDPPNCRVRLR